MTATALPIPTTLIERLQALLPPAAFEAYAAQFSLPTPTAFRANPLKTSTADLIAELADQKFDLTPLPWKNDAYTVPEEQRTALTHSPACTEGRLYIQNPSSMLPPLLLNPGPDDWILDLAAAPGSKTTQIAAMMGNAGRISAVERSRNRFFRLRANLQTQGVTNTRTYLRDGSGVGGQLPERFDRVLLDAPCSSEGRFPTAGPPSWADWSLKKIRRLQRLQKRLLDSGIHALKPGGILVYATCTFAPEENELVLQDALDRHGEHIQLEEINLPCPNAVPALQTWHDHTLDPQIYHAQRILPNGSMEGFFIACLRKHSSTDNSSQ